MLGPRRTPQPRPGSAQGRQHLADARAEADALALGAQAEALEGHPVAVLQEGADHLAALQPQLPGAVPRQLEQGAVAPLLWAGDGAGADEVPRAEVAAAHRVVRELLRRGPVHVPQVAARDRLRGRHARRLQQHLQVQVHALQAARGLAQVRQGCRLLLRRRRRPEGREGRQGHHPGRDARAEVLPQEGPEGHILPPLDVPGAPVVQEHQAEDVLLRGWWFGWEKLEIRSLSQQVFGTSRFLGRPGFWDVRVFVFWGCPGLLGVQVFGTSGFGGRPGSFSALNTFLARRFLSF